MSGSLLGVLSKGRTRVNERLNSRSRKDAIREWVKAHEYEIRSAKQRGYTWKEITRACIEVWNHTDEFHGVYIRKAENLIQECYYDVKQGRKSKHFLKDKKAKMSCQEYLNRTRMLSED